jgi:hypothetical protein
VGLDPPVKGMVAGGEGKKVESEPPVLRDGRE